MQSNKRRTLSQIVTLRERVFILSLKDVDNKLRKRGVRMCQEEFDLKLQELALKF